MLCWQVERTVQRGDVPVTTWTWLPAPQLGPGEGARPFDPKRDLRRLSAKDDYSTGLVDYCPVHGANVTLMHGGMRCPAHQKIIMHINAKRERSKHEAAKREERRAFVRVNGIHGPPR